MANGHNQDMLDRDQFGGASGYLVADHLIEVMNFILYNQDLSEPVSAMLTAADIHLRVSIKLDTVSTRLVIENYL